MTRAQFADFLRREHSSWEGHIRSIGLTPQQRIGSMASPSRLVIDFHAHFVGSDMQETTMRHAPFALTLARCSNELVAALVAKYPNRSIGLGSPLVYLDS